jgi:catechol 2,3-dioxygenase-like lactoylglutathione lyase family enzyme
MATFSAVEPVLPVRDVDAAVQYYVNRLGFRLVWNSSNYGVVQRGSVALHLQWQHESDFKRGTAGQGMLRFVVDDPDALYAEYSAKEVFHNRTRLQDTSWNTREFAFFDLNGNGLTFYRDL